MNGFGIAQDAFVKHFFGLETLWKNHALIFTVSDVLESHRRSRYGSADGFR